MPIYEYICEICNNVFEVFSTGEDKKVICPLCSGEKVRRKVSVFAAHGTGSKAGTSTSSGSSCGTCSSRNCSSCGL